MANKTKLKLEQFRATTVGRSNQTTPPCTAAAALLYGTRPAPLLFGAWKPANMAAPFFLTLPVATLATLALLSLGSPAAGHIEVGIGVC